MITKKYYKAFFKSSAVASGLIAFVGLALGSEATFATFFVLCMMFINGDINSKAP